MARRRQQGWCGGRRRFVLSLCAPILVCSFATAQEQEVGPPFEARERTALEIQELPGPLAGPPEPVAAHDHVVLPGIGNNDVLEMARAQFGDATIVAAIAANETRFDISPKALLALKSGGVSERVIEAMLAVEATKKQAAAIAAAAAPPAETAAAISAQSAGQMTPEQLAALSQVLEKLAIQSAATEPEPAAAEPDLSAVESQVPRAWLGAGENRTALAPTIAQVALTDTKRGAGAFKTLQGFAGKALAFANPAFSGLADGLGGLFQPNDPDATAVWALLGASASRQFAVGTQFEVEFGNIPGINPDEYRPAIVLLVPTGDNYRLVGAAKTKGGEGGVIPNGPIIQELVASQLTQLARGRYRVALTTPIPPGEYALVLRPIVTRERGRRKESKDTLGELMGGGASQILYMTWDFSVKP